MSLCLQFYYNIILRNLLSVETTQELEVKKVSQTIPFPSAIHRKGAGRELFWNLHFVHFWDPKFN